MHFYYCNINKIKKEEIITNNDITVGHVINRVVKDSSGEITGYELENKEIVMKEQAVALAKEGAIKGVVVSKSKSGEEYLKSSPDTNKMNNLDNLPVINDEELF